MLQVDLRAARTHAVETTGEFQPDDPLFAGLDFSLAAPVAVQGRLTHSGPGRYYWHAELSTEVAASCRRCLAPVRIQLAPEVRLLFTEDVAADDPVAHLIPPRATELELDDAVREELILAAPEYVLCRDDCRGICPRCGKELNEGPCACEPERDPRWAALDALRGQWTDGQE